jgi:hypothetical protein
MEKIFKVEQIVVETTVIRNTSWVCAESLKEALLIARLNEWNSEYICTTPVADETEGHEISLDEIPEYTNLMDKNGYK